MELATPTLGASPQMLFLTTFLPLLLLAFVSTFYSDLGLLRP